jgi:hypothetical protein
MNEQDDLLDPTITSNTSSNGNGSGTLPNSTSTLVLGIISIVGCLLYGVPGLICGIIALSLHQKDKRIYAENPGYYEASFKNAKAGYICAIVGTSLSAAYFLFAIIAFGIIASNGGRF